MWTANAKNGRRINCRVKWEEKAEAPRVRLGRVRHDPVSMKHDCFEREMYFLAYPGQIVKGLSVEDRPPMRTKSNVAKSAFMLTSLFT